jgi:hypothetical protein
VELDDLAPAARALGDPVDLALEDLEVRMLGRVIRSGDDDGAAAEEAEPLAEG